MFILYLGNNNNLPKHKEFIGIGTNKMIVTYFIHIYIHYHNM